MSAAANQNAEPANALGTGAAVVVAGGGAGDGDDGEGAGDGGAGFVDGSAGTGVAAVVEGATVVVSSPRVPVVVGAAVVRANEVDVSWVGGAGCGCSVVESGATVGCGVGCGVGCRVGCGVGRGDGQGVQSDLSCGSIPTTSSYSCEVNSTVHGATVALTALHTERPSVWWAGTSGYSIVTGVTSTNALAQFTVVTSLLCHQTSM
mmetsp:Transcript_71536/g.197522  ORF Transcript_71536/g.197522 Transcript_71536/m.197522 type:complete len:205 (+) Transcript_71536:204-818(+)